MLGDYETYPYDDLGNRDGSVNFYNSADVLQSSTPYAVDDETNRYTAISSTSVTHDDAGNLYRGYFLSDRVQRGIVNGKNLLTAKRANSFVKIAADHRGYHYEYDYENRLPYSPAIPITPANPSH